MKIQKKKIFLGGGRGRGGFRLGGGGVRMDVNYELKFCENTKKKYFFFWGGGPGRVGGGGGGSGWM